VLPFKCDWSEQTLSGSYSGDASRSLLCSIKRCARHWQKRYLFQRCFQRSRERWNRVGSIFFSSRARRLCYVRFFLRPDGARPYYPNSPTRTPSTIIIIWRRRATESKSGGMDRECMCERDLMCHPSLPALCRLHFIIICESGGADLTPASAQPKVIRASE
jgi:hypothetical protein